MQPEQPVRRYRVELVRFCVVTVIGFVISFAGGFTIGRFSSLLPLLLTAYAVSRFHPIALQLAAWLLAVLLYVMFAWLIPEQVHYWGIQIELPITLLAYAVAFLLPPRSVQPAATGKVG
jgi:uncharacterized membrane protein YczE